MSTEGCWMEWGWWCRRDELTASLPPPCTASCKKQYRRLKYHICIRLAVVKSKPSTPLSDRKMTGYFPIYSSQSSLLPEIYKPSNKDLSVPISKKLFNMLILRVFPKRRGRVKRVTSLHLYKSYSISLVLST